MYSQRQPSGGAPPGTQSSMNQDSGARRPLSTHIPQTPSGLRGAGPQRQFHRSGQSGSPPLPSQGIIGQGNPHTPQPSQRGFGMRSGPDASGLDDSFGPTTQQRHRGASVSMNLASLDTNLPCVNQRSSPLTIPSLISMTQWILLIFPTIHSKDPPIAFQEGISRVKVWVLLLTIAVRAPATMHPCHCTVVDRLVEDAAKHRWKIIRVVLCTQGRILEGGPM